MGNKLRHRKNKTLRLFYALAILGIIPLGLLIRQFYEDNEPTIGGLMGFLSEYAPDALYALMVYWIFRWIFVKKGVQQAFLLALCFCVAIEILQFYHAPWIDAIRSYSLGGLILGYHFLWSDLFYYTAGVSLGLGLDLFIVNYYQKKPRIGKDETYSQ